MVFQHRKILEVAYKGLFSVYTFRIGDMRGERIRRGGGVSELYDTCNTKIYFQNFFSTISKERYKYKQQFIKRCSSLYNIWAHSIKGYEKLEILIENIC